MKLDMLIREILTEMPLGRRPEVLRKLEELRRLASETGPTVPGQASKSGSQFESGVCKAAKHENCPTCDCSTVVYDPDMVDKFCVCGHVYYRHFDSYYDEVFPVGCKYCPCSTFETKTESTL